MASTTGKGDTAASIRPDAPGGISIGKRQGRQTQSSLIRPISLAADCQNTENDVNDRFSEAPPAYVWDAE